MLFAALLAVTTSTAVSQQCAGGNIGNGPNGVSDFDVGGAFGSSAPPRNLLPNLTGRTCSCSQYSSSSCCTPAYMAAVQAGPESIYQGWTYNQCNRTVSSACRAFMNAQECNYGCSPTHSMKYSQGTPIPLCGSYCDAWFNACADELTCSSVWGNSWPILPGGYVCNTTRMDGFAFQPCKTFRDTFGSAQGMCGGLTTAPSPPKAALWGNTYRYDATNNPATCTSFLPNFPAAPPAIPAVCASGASSTTYATLSFLLSIAAILVMM